MRESYQKTWGRWRWSSVIQEQNWSEFETESSLTITGTDQVEPASTDDMTMISQPVPCIPFWTVT